MLNNVINETEINLYRAYIVDTLINLMSAKQSGAIKAVEVMLNRSLIRLENLKGIDREALYDEYKEWLEVDENNILNDGVLYCNYLG